MVAFGGTRTWHRLVSGIEDAGFEIRDSIAWLYGSGFPKSLNVSKAIDKAAGAEREVVGPHQYAARKPKSSAGVTSVGLSVTPGYDLTAPATPEAAQWEGYGTALKPAHEPICVARKPLNGTVAANVLKWGTGAINIDAMRIGTGGHLHWTAPRDIGYSGGGSNTDTAVATQSIMGRWPANVTLDEHTAALLDQQIYGDTDGVSRFFYTAKAPASERITIDGITHVTVKPLDLMRWLVRGFAPPGSLILDPFAGSGTTGEAAISEGNRAVLIEQDSQYLPLIKARVTRRTDPVEHLRTTGEDLGLFDL
jgi:site-specific DNA-methyltransferase (adenine-specific)